MLPKIIAKHTSGIPISSRITIVILKFEKMVCDVGIAAVIAPAVCGKEPLVCLQQESVEWTLKIDRAK